MRRRAAFTLVELLVVIGIIVVLIGILIPVMSGAREASKRTKCMSNLHQISLAMLMYANDHWSKLPRSAPQCSSGGYEPMPHDWVHWNYGRDVRQSPIARYVKGFHEDLLICPSDPGTRLREVSSPEEGRYRYSYAMNMFLGSLWTTGDTTNLLSRIKNASEKILLLEEDFTTIDDGNWYPNYGSYANLLGIRHDRSKRQRIAPGDGDEFPSVPDADAKGNVAMADGHVEYVTRHWAHDPIHYMPRR